MHSFFSTYLLLANINFLLRKQSASSLVIPTFNAGTVTILLIHIDTSFLLMSHFFNILLFSLPYRLLDSRSYLYLLSFPFRPYHLSLQLLHLVHYRFILVLRVPTPGLLMTYLLWHPPPRCRSYSLLLILTSPFGKVLVPLIILILFILSYLIIVYFHHILLLFPPRLFFSIPHTVHEALSHLVPLPFGKSPVSYCWVYTVKISPDGRVDRLKACLVAKRYTQIYGSDYYDTFSLISKMAFVHLLLFVVAMSSWPLYQLDIKNVFLHGNLTEEVYMEQPLGFVA